MTEDRLKEAGVERVPSRAHPLDGPPQGPPPPPPPSPPQERDPGE